MSALGDRLEEISRDLERLQRDLVTARYRAGRLGSAHELDLEIVLVHSAAITAEGAKKWLSRARLQRRMTTASTTRRNSRLAKVAQALAQAAQSPARAAGRRSSSTCTVRVSTPSAPAHTPLPLIHRPLASGKPRAPRSSFTGWV